MEQIINPKTKRFIKIGGPSYKKLINEGYKESYLNSLKNINNLQLNTITDQPIHYNDDIMTIVIQTLQLPELYALYHTSKYFHKLFNTKQILDNLINDFEIKAATFDDFISILIKNYLKIDFDQNKIFDEYQIIENAFINNHEKITMCRTRRLDQNIICIAKFYLLKKGFSKEIENLSGSKTDDQYIINLKNLKYQLYYDTLKLINYL